MHSLAKFDVGRVRTTTCTLDLGMADKSARVKGRNGA
jgi:hypothetical protein